MKTDPTKKTIVNKEKTKIETDLPMSEKDEVKKAEDKMRESAKKVKGK